MDSVFNKNSITPFNHSCQISAENRAQPEILAKNRVILKDVCEP
jgi:hypothetical protein